MYIHTVTDSLRWVPSSLYTFLFLHSGLARDCRTRTEFPEFDTLFTWEFLPKAPFKLIQESAALPTELYAPSLIIYQMCVIRKFF